MRETFKDPLIHTPWTAEQVRDPALPRPEEPEPAGAELQRPEDFSVLGGEYQDPDPSMVDWIHRSIKDPGGGVEATVMKAFEFAGIVKTRKELKALTKPLEQSGALPLDAQSGNQPEYETDPTVENELTKAMDMRYLLELEEGNDTRNYALLVVREMTELREEMTKDEIDRLRNEGRSHIRNAGGLPPAQKIIAVMAGVSQPENTNNALKTQIPVATFEMATDVYWMMLQAETKLRKIEEAA